MTGFLTIFTGPSHRPDFAQNPSQSRHGDGAARFERSLWRAGTGWDGFAAAARAATSGKGWTLHDSGGMATLFGDSYAVNGACLTLWPGLRLWQAGNRPGLGGTVWRADVWAHSGVLLSLPGRTAWPMLVRRALTGGTGYGGPAPPALEGRFGGQADGSMAALSCRCPVELPGRCWSGGALVGEKCGIPHGKWEGDGASVREIRALTGRFGGQADGRMAVFSCHCPVELSGRCWSGGALARGTGYGGPAPPGLGGTVWRADVWAHGCALPFCSVWGGLAGVGVQAAAGREGASRL